MLLLITVIVATIIHFGVGMIWYQNLGSQWAEAYHVKMDELTFGQKEMAQGVGVSFLTAIGLTYVISGMGINETFDGARVGFFAWLFFIAPVQYSGVIWANKPIKGFLIDTGCDLLAFVLVGGFIGALL